MTERRNRFQSGTQHQLDRWLAFAFGIIFISILLYLVTVVSNPSPLAIQVYVTVLALCAGGIGAILPGFLEIRYKNQLRAGGALALALLVYLNEPAIGRNVVNYDIPDVSPNPLAKEYLDAVDHGNLDRVWSLLSDLGRRHVANDQEEFARLYSETIKPLGEVKSRVLVGFNTLESPSGAPPGLYRVLTYKTHYENDDGFRQEAIGMRANSEGEWDLYSHQVSPSTTPQ